MEKKQEIVSKFETLYNENIERVGRFTSDYINGFRGKALKEFMELGIPDRKVENYKCTNLEPWFRSNYKSFFIPDETDFSVAQDFRCEIDTLDVHELILVNGFYPSGNGSMKQLDSGVWLGSLSDASEKFKDIVKAHYAKYAFNGKDGLIPLNTALASDGIFVYVPSGIKLDKPVKIFLKPDPGIVHIGRQ